jgi:hypothetical protein
MAIVLTPYLGRCGSLHKVKSAREFSHRLRRCSLGPTPTEELLAIDKLLGKENRLFEGVVAGRFSIPSGWSHMHAHIDGTN